MCPWLQKHLNVRRWTSEHECVRRGGERRGGGLGDTGGIKIRGTQMNDLRMRENVEMKIWRNYDE